LLCKKSGAGLTYTGLLNPKTKEKLFFDDKPAVQFACNSSDGIKEFIKKYDKKVLLYDLNLGCPSPHAKTTSVGYFMIDNLNAIESILKEIKSHTKKPVTIKIRKMPEEKAKKIIEIANKYCDAIAVHPRTLQQGYAGIPDIEFARFVKTLTKLPIIYSGNINNLEQAEKMLKEFDFIMIGRSAFGNPSIFSDLTNKKIKKRILFMDWFNLIKKIYPEVSFNQIKLQANNFTKGMDNARKIREKLIHAKTEKDVLEIMSG
jgi:tRNA-dihydrouridine synthase B